MQSLQEVLRAWLATAAISAQRLTARDQAEHQCRDSYMASHCGRFSHAGRPSSLAGRLKGCEAGVHRPARD
jgi:hypothetical protein